MHHLTTPRRQFLKNTALTSAGLALLGFQNLGCMSTQNTPYLDTIGLQLWTVRDQIEKDPEGTLKALKAMGYQQIELMDTRQIAKLKPIADDLGLAVNSSFILWTTLTGNWDLVPHETDRSFSFEQIVADAEKAGLDHLVFGYLMKEERSSIDDYKKYCDALNKSAELCQSAGIQLCYHNHSFEFGPINGQVPFEILIERLDPKGVQFELDVFWAQIGGYDSVELTKRLVDRIRLLHLKDLKKDTAVIFDEGAVPHEAFLELGNGMVDLLAIVEIGYKAGVKYCFVEQDWSDDPIISVEESVNYFKSMKG